MKNGPN